MTSRILLIFLFISFNLFADVKFKLPQVAIINEPFVFSIEATGETVEFPEIKNIDSYLVQEVSSSSSTSIVNSKITKKIKKTFSLFPKNDFVIPSLSFKIDGDIYNSQEQKISLSKAQKSISDTFDLKISSSKTDLYMGENFILTIVLKFKKDTQILDMAFQNPNFENFWFKQLNDTSRYTDGDYEVQQLKFLMIPLKDGTIDIPPLSIVAQIIDRTKSSSYSLFSNVTKNEKIYSNSITLNVKKLPLDVKLIGDFKIDSTIDKNEINLGDAVSYKLKIEGIGNIEDIPNLKLDIPDATVYENKPIIKSEILNDDLFGTYEKVFSIIPNSSTTIPKIELKYFDSKTQSVKTLLTNEYKIVVNQKPIISENKLEKQVTQTKVSEEKIVYKSSLKEKIIYFVLGILVTIIAFIIYIYFKRVKNTKQVYNTPLIKKIKSSKSKDELLKLLAIYINFDKKLDELIFKLEKENDIKLIKQEIEKKIIELKL